MREEQALDQLDLLIQEYDPEQSDWRFRKSVMMQLIDRIRPATLRCSAVSAQPYGWHAAANGLFSVDPRCAEVWRHHMGLDVTPVYTRSTPADEPHVYASVREAAERVLATAQSADQEQTQALGDLRSALDAEPQSAPLISTDALSWLCHSGYLSVSDVEELTDDFKVTQPRRSQAESDK